MSCSIELSMKKFFNLGGRHLAASSLAVIFTGVYLKNIFSNQDMVGYVNGQHSKIPL